MHKLETSLEPCQREIFERAPSQRSEADLAVVLVLLQEVPLFAALCWEAQRCIAAHARLLLLTDGVEMPRKVAVHHRGSFELWHEEDSQRLYAVIHGPVLLLHGDPNATQLQQYLLHSQHHSSYSDVQMPRSTDVTADTGLETTSHAADADYVNCVSTGPKSSGTWQRVRALVSAGSKQKVLRGMQATLERGSDMHGNLTPDLLQQLRHADSNSLPETMAQAAQNERVEAAVEPLLQLVRTQSVDVGATFCGHQFPNAAPTVFTAAAGYSGDDAPQLSQLPNSCLAAIAEAKGMATLLSISKPAYMEAMRLQHEHHVSCLMDMMCRIPCLRHTPIKELHKLAAHMKEAKFEPGQTLLQQGKEVKEVHFLVSGTVQIIYSPSLVAPQYRASIDTAAATEVAAGTAATLGGKVTVDPLAASSQATIIPPQVLGTRGPGCVLGDDAMRERRLAVGVVAATAAVTLKVAPQKLLCVLDPLTLRLFGRLRQQQPQAQQQVIQEALSEAIHQADQQPVSQQLQSLALNQVNESMGRTDKPHGMHEETESHNHRPPWHSIRGKVTLESTPPGAVNNNSKVTCQSPHSRPSCKQHGRSCIVRTVAHRGNDNAMISNLHVKPEEDIKTWRESLPKGLILDKCVGLPHSASVTQLIGMVKDIESSKTQQLSHQHCLSATTSTSTTFTGAQGSTIMGASSFVAQRSQYGDRDARTTASTDQLGGGAHTELLESCGVAVLQMKVLPGQAPVSAAAFAGVLDDIAATWSAVTHDEGLQLVRWTSCRWIMIVDLEPGSSKRSGLEGLAGAVLSAAMHLSGVVARSADVLPVVGLAAGVASGSCFMQFEAGNFLHNISGRAYEAANELCLEAAVTPVAQYPNRQSSSKSSSHVIIKVSDGVAGTLQTNYCLEACSGGSFLLAAKPVQTSPTGSRPVSPQYPCTSLPRNTVGFGRNSVNTNGVVALSPVTPKTPGGGLLLPNWGKAQNVRRQMRRKFEALQDLLAGGGDTLPPPPEYMLTQPPPVSGSPQFLNLHQPSGGSDTGGYTGLPAKSGTPDKQGRVNISSSFTGAANKSEHSLWSGSGRAKPKLTISVDGGPVESPDCSGSVLDSSTDICAERPQSSGSTSSLAVDTGSMGSDINSRAILTPTLVMDKPPWSLLQQQQQRPPSAETRRLVATSCDSNTNLSLNYRQSEAVLLPNSRQSFKRKVLQEVQDMRAEAVPPYMHHAATSVASSGEAAKAGKRSSVSNARHAVSCRVMNKRLIATSMAATACGTAVPSNSGSGAKVASSSCFASLTGNRSVVVSEQQNDSRPRSAGVLHNEATDKLSSNGAKLRVTFQTPKGHRHSRVANSSRVSSMNGAGDSVDGGQQQQQRMVQQSGRYSLIKQPCRDVQYCSGANGLSLSSDTASAKASATLASKSSMIRASMEGEVAQQQQQLTSECSQSDSLNSLSMYTEAVLAGSSSSSKGEAAAVRRQLLEAQRQQLLVMSACKALGSCAAAESYVAALPEGLLSVNLSAAGLNRLPPLSRLTQLEQLSASFNKLDSLPNLVPASAATAAEAADAAADASNSRCPVTPQGADSSNRQQREVLEQLTHQLLSGKVSALPTSLRHLGLAHNQLSHVPLELPAALPGLTLLDLSHNQLTGLPATFGILSCLKVLLMSYNQITALPGSFTRLFSLQNLDVSHNQLTQLPNSLDQLSALTSLQLQHNPLQGLLPLELSKLSGLRSLGLGCIGLTGLPVELLSGLSELTSLDLSGNGLQDVMISVDTKCQTGAGSSADSPAAAGTDASGSNMVSSDAGGVQEQHPEQRGVQQFAAAVVAAGGAAPQAAASTSDELAMVAGNHAVLLPSLQVLDLSFNRLQQLPHWLPISLKHLTASNNQITSISNELCNRLSGLAILDLHNNDLLDLPQGVTSMERLQILALGGNSGLDCEVVASQVDHGGMVDVSAKNAQSKTGESGGHSHRVGSAKSEKGGSSGGGILWTYKLMMQRKAAAAAELVRIAQLQRQQAQQRQQVTGSLLKGLLPGIRQTVIVESGRAL